MIARARRIAFGISGFFVFLAERARAEIGNPPMETTMPQTPAQQAAMAQAVGLLTITTLVEAAVVIVEVVTEAGLVAALGNGISTAAAVGTAEGVVAGAAIGVVAGAIVIGTVLAVVLTVIAINAVNNSPPGATAGAGASGEMTNDMAAANEAAAAEATAAANLAAIIASFPPNPLPLPTVRFSVNPATGEVTVTSVDGIDTGQGATPNTCCPGFTTSQQIDLSPAITVTPGPSDLPDIGESVPGSDTPGLDVGLDVSVSDSGAFGWVDGHCQHYATGLDCDDYREEYAGAHGYVHHADYAHTSQSIPAPEALVLILSIAILMIMAKRVSR